MLRSLIQNAQSENRWPASILPDEQTLAFLEISYKHIPPKGQGRINRIFAGNADKREIESTVYELVAYELFLRLDLSPKFQPCICSKTPNLSFVASGQTFLADVFVAHTPEQFILGGESAQPLEGEGDATKKIRDRILEKAVNYIETETPLVPLVFFGDYQLTPLNCLQALLQEYYDPESESFPDKVHWGIFCEEVPDISPEVRASLSAVVCCSWFRSGSPQYTSRLLQGLVVHNCSALVRLPTTALEQFPQLTCKNGNLRDDWSCSPSTVAKLSAQGSIEFEVYSSS